MENDLQKNGRQTNQKSNPDGKRKKIEKKD